MAERIDHGPVQCCSYRARCLGHHAAGRLADYFKPFTISPPYYVVSDQARLVNLIGLERRWTLLHETTPFLRLGWRHQIRLSACSWIAPTLRLPVDLCSLLDFRGWHHGYYHWFLDCLPRLLAAEHHRQRTGAEVKILVPAKLQPWLSESLLCMGWNSRTQIPADSNGRFNNIRPHRLIASSSHRHQHATAAPFDALSPPTLKQIRTRLAPMAQKAAAASLSTRRLFISRRGAISRRIINEDEIMPTLVRHGFSCIELERHSLSTQVALFAEATHSITMHGAGLTNLIHACGGSLLELFARGHGIRPEYFQIAGINHMDYFFHVCDSINPSHDVILDPGIVEEFLAATLDP